jgi:valyl-tRNA synthetase
VEIYYNRYTLKYKSLESSKVILQDENSSEDKKNGERYILLYTLENILKIMHPFTPFVTEEIWKDFPKENNDLLMVESWD